MVERNMQRSMFIKNGFSRWGSERTSKKVTSKRKRPARPVRPNAFHVIATGVYMRARRVLTAAAHYITISISIIMLSNGRESIVDPG